MLTEAPRVLKYPEPPKFKKWPLFALKFIVLVKFSTTVVLYQNFSRIACLYFIAYFIRLLINTF